MAGGFSRSPCIREIFPKNLPRPESECQTIISLQNLLCLRPKYLLVMATEL